MEAAGFQLPRPPATTYTKPIQTACGALDKVNASYCGADQRIYYSAELPNVFPPEVRNTPFLMEMIIAHEFGHVDDRHGVAARIAVGPAEGVELAPGQPVKTGFLGQLPRYGEIRILAVLDEPAGNRPLPGERFAAALDQQQVVSDRTARAGPAHEHRSVHGQRGIAKTRSQAVAVHGVTCPS